MDLAPERVQILAVWIDMLDTDDRRAAEAAASIFEPFPSVVQFHDPKAVVGAAVASAIGSPGRTAWDMYLFYPPGVRFEAELPPPQDWAHQLGQTGWADPSRCYWEEDLPDALRAKMLSLLGKDIAS